MILSDIWWHTLGRSAIDCFDPNQVNPGSYDVRLDDRILLQRFRGRAYNNVVAHLNRDSTMEFVDPETGLDVICEARFKAGDAFLGSTIEYVRLSRWTVMMYLDKSSTGREGLSNRHAGLIDAGFHGTITLEHDVLRDGLLTPYKRIGQLVAHPTFAWKPYHHRGGSKYIGQQGVTANRNTNGLAFRADT